MEQSYELHQSISIRELSSELDKLWDELRSDSELRRQAEEAGIDLKPLQTLERNQAIEVKRVGAALDPVAAAIIVAFAPVVAKIVADLWTHVLLPRIKGDLGSDAIRPKRQG